jgi:hypothetical protein
VVGRSRVHVPVGIHLVRGGGVVGRVVLLLAAVRMVEAAIATKGNVPNLVADLADRA